MQTTDSILFPVQVPDWGSQILAKALLSLSGAKRTDSIMIISVIMAEASQIPQHMVLAPVTIERLMRWIRSDSTMHQVLMGLATQIKLYITLNLDFTYEKFITGLAQALGPNFPKDINASEDPQLATYDSTPEQRLKILQIYEWLVPFALVVMHSGEIAGYMSNPPGQNNGQ